MPDRKKSIVSIPLLDPEAWEDFPTFRETLLMYIANEEVADAFRFVGKFLYNIILEAREQAVPGDESSTRLELHAALADLRHLQGFLTTVGRESEVSSLPQEDARLSLFAASQARELAAMAERLEAELEA